MPELGDISNVFFKSHKKRDDSLISTATRSSGGSTVLTAPAQQDNQPTRARSSTYSGIPSTLDFGPEFGAEWLRDYEERSTVSFRNFEIPSFV
jgi:hypothetical protein